MFSRLTRGLVHFNNIQFERKYTAIEQVEALGFSPNDVRNIVLTHLDFDHAGGLEDFPEATVHVMQTIEPKFLGKATVDWLLSRNVSL